MEIRTAEIDDASLLLKYLSEFISENCKTVPTLDSLPSLEQEIEWIKRRIGDKGVVMIAVEAGKIIGIIETSLSQVRELKHNCEFGMSVLEKYRTKGFGRKLLEAFIKWTQKRDLIRIELNVFSNNAAAIKLYNNMGFREDGRRVNAVKLSDEKYCDLVHMYKWGY